MQLVDLQRFIDELKQTRESLLNDQLQINYELDQIEREINLVETVRYSYLKHYGLPLPTEPEVDPYLQKKFAHLSIKDMLIRIAKENDGILDITQARQLLVRATVFKDERNATTSIVSILSRNDDVFRRVNRGLYMLVHTFSAPEAPMLPFAVSPNPSKATLEVVSKPTGAFPVLTYALGTAPQYPFKSQTL